MAIGATTGSARWVRDLIAAHWSSVAGATLGQLGSAEGSRPVSHTASLWRCDTATVSRVLKVGLNPDAVRERRFYDLKRDVVDHCRRHGVPAPAAEPTDSGAPVWWSTEAVCEMLPLHTAPPLRAAGPQAVRPAVAAALDLRRALDDLPAGCADELAGIPVDPLVEQPDWEIALDEAFELHRASAGRRDTWGVRAHRALDEVVETAELTRRGAGDPGRGTVRAVVHADLHRDHFLVRGDRVEAVLDFDNLGVGDRLLDLAWTAELPHSAGTLDPDAADAVVGDLARTLMREDHASAADLRRTMPLLLRRSLPVVVDIAKDILQREIFDLVWLDYLDLLSPRRRARVHDVLVAEADRA